MRTRVFTNDLLTEFADLLLWGHYCTCIFATRSNITKFSKKPRKKEIKKKC